MCYGQIQQHIHGTDEKDRCQNEHCDDIKAR